MAAGRSSVMLPPLREGLLLWVTQRKDGSGCQGAQMMHSYCFHPRPMSLVSEALDTLSRLRPLLGRRGDGPGSGSVQEPGGKAERPCEAGARQKGRSQRGNGAGRVPAGRARRPSRQAALGVPKQHRAARGRGMRCCRGRGSARLNPKYRWKRHPCQPGHSDQYLHSASHGQRRPRASCTLRSLAGCLRKKELGAGGRDPSGVYEGMKPSNLCCSGCEEIHRFLAMPRGSACLGDAYKHTLLLCVAEEAFCRWQTATSSPGGGRSGRCSRHLDVSLDRFVGCEVRSGNAAVVSAGKAQRMSTRQLSLPHCRNLNDQPAITRAFLPLLLARPPCGYGTQSLCVRPGQRPAACTALPHRILRSGTKSSAPAPNPPLPHRILRSRTESSAPAPNPPLPHRILRSRTESTAPAPNPPLPHRIHRCHTESTAPAPNPPLPHRIHRCHTESTATVPNPLLPYRIHCSRTESSAPAPNPLLPH